MSAAVSLEEAVLARLRADVGLTALLGPGRVHDGAPKNAPAPFVSLDRVETAEAGGVEAGLARHRLELRAVSRAGGKREAARIASAVDTALADAPLVLAGHRLVLLRVAGIDIRVSRDRALAEAVLRVEAMTEVV